MARLCSTWPTVSGDVQQSLPMDLLIWCAVAAGRASADRPIFGTTEPEIRLRTRWCCLRNRPSRDGQLIRRRSTLALDQVVFHSVGSGCGTGADIELVEDVLDVRTGRPLADVQSFADPPI